MPTQPLQCPFCATTSTRGTGLTAHIRGRHPKEYSRWVKDPNRLQAALKAAKSNNAAAKKKAPSKSASAVSGSFVCPGCGKAFKTLAALGGHRAYLHKSAPKKAAQPISRQIARAVSSIAGKRKAGTPKPQIFPSSMAVAPSPILNSAHEHLRAAREALVGRDQYIEGELKRLTELQAEKERVRRELDALDTALEVFGANA